MQTPKSSFHLRVTLPTVVLIMVLAGFSLCVALGDAHWLNRTGALIAAVAAGAIMLQIRAELGLEKQKEVYEKREEDIVHRADPSLPVDKLALRLSINQLGVRREELRHHRLQVAKYVTATAIIGELLHGFGDLLVCALASVCRH